MRSKQIRLYFTEGEWTELEKQQQLGRHRTIGQTIEAIVGRYQESYTGHLTAPLIGQSPHKVVQTTSVAPQPPPKPIQPLPAANQIATPTPNPPPEW